MKKIGIIQGRLSKPFEGFQECPYNWKREFDLLQELGLNHVEWIVTKERYFENPIHSSDLKEFRISSVCADFLVNKNFLTDEVYWERFNAICQAAQKNQISFITIPLLEGSSVLDDERRKEFIKRMASFSSRYPDLNFSIEAELASESLLEIVDLFENAYVTYDTGNMTSFGVDHVQYLDRIKHKLNNIHLKDRNRNGESFLPGAGETDFALIFNELKRTAYNGVHTNQKTAYNGLYTIQTAREKDGDEKQTILNHKKYFKEVYNANKRSF